MNPYDPTAARAARLARLGWIAARGWSVLCAALVIVALTHQNEPDPLGALLIAALGLAPWAVAWAWRGRLGA